MDRFPCGEYGRHSPHSMKQLQVFNLFMLFCDDFLNIVVLQRNRLADCLSAAV